MNNSEITLCQFFPLKELRQERLSAIESSNKIASLKERVSKEAKGIRWPVELSEIIKKVEDLLNISMPDIMVSAWNKYRILARYADKGKYKPNETFLVPLAEHTIKSEHNPYIEILINDSVVSKIEFNINVSLFLKGFVLKIQDGKIKEILAGSCKGKGLVKCEDLVMLEKETESIPLPGSIKLGEGIAIVN